MGRTEVETFNADSSFLTEAEHADLTNLAYYTEITRVANEVTSIDSWETSAKTIKRFEASFVRVSGLINTMTQRFFDYNGVLYRQIVSTFTRDVNKNVISISHAKTPANSSAINY